MRLEDLFYLNYSGYYPHLYCYLHKISADVPSGLLQVFLVGIGNLLELENLLVVIGNLLVVIGSHHGTLNPTLYSIHGGIRFLFLGVSVLLC